MTSRDRDSAASEIVFGLVGAIGTDLTRVRNTLEIALRDVNYQPQEIHISRLFALAVDGLSIPERPLDQRYHALMDAGDTLRTLVKRGDAAAALAMLGIREHRRSFGDPNTPIPRTAYILRQLKHPDEVETLRTVYGPGFFLIAAYSPRDERLSRLERRIGESYPTHGDYRRAAEDLVQRDEKAKAGFGQNVRDTFPRADVFIDASASENELKDSITRFVELVFGFPFHTPTRDENAMFHAHAAALRSAEMGRQVGAAITNDDGDLIAVGANEVPKFGGGTYWPPRPGERDSRDFTHGADRSDLIKRKNLGEVLAVLRDNTWLRDDLKERGEAELLDNCLPLMKNTRLMNSIEFGRAVHAEMDAITSTARRGVSIRGSTLYTTTFPCHNCARHIVAAGVERVVYIEPYAKSLASQFHNDSIAVEANTCGQQVVFQPFVGVSPRAYTALFSMPPRKRSDGSGSTTDWNRKKAVPRLVPPRLSSNALEQIWANGLHIALLNNDGAEIALNLTENSDG